MAGTVLQLLPQPSRECELNGLYLAHDLRQYARARKEPYIYANFVTSLDGRIAVKAAHGGGRTVPPNVANERDWRLYQEMAAQSSLVLSTGRYLRDWAEGRAQEILQVEDPRFADLREWRVERGLRRQPDIGIISASLDFPLPPLLREGGRRVVFFTTQQADLERVRELQRVAGEVRIAGKKRVSGGLLRRRIQELGYKTVYSGAGPQVLSMLLEARVLDRLYLTITNRILGGDEFDTIVKGPYLKPPVDFKLDSLYFDPYGLEGLGQMFVAYNREGEAGDAADEETDDIVGD
jgi:riboflavin biosynthesis pyrimidine reductase